MDDPGVRSLPFAAALASVTRLAERADQAAAAMRGLLVCVPRSTDWYEVHRQMWIRYGDLADLTAMKEEVHSCRRT